MNPLSYGYIRVTDELDDDELRQLEQGIRKLAEAEGFQLMEIWHEYQDGHYGTFYEVLEELRHAQKGHALTRIGHVVVPSLDHLPSHPLLQEQLLMRLKDAKAHIWVVDAVTDHERR